MIPSISHKRNYKFYWQKETGVLSGITGCQNIVGINDPVQVKLVQFELFTGLNSLSSACLLSRNLD